jgi:hypothetical protein
MDIDIKYNNMGKQNKELLENIKKHEKEKVKQQESKILEQRKIKNTKNQKENTFRYYR